MWGIYIKSKGEEKLLELVFNQYVSMCKQVLYSKMYAFSSKNYYLRWQNLGFAKSWLASLEPKGSGVLTVKL